MQLDRHIARRPLAMALFALAVLWLASGSGWARAAADTVGVDPQEQSLEGLLEAIAEAQKGRQTLRADLFQRQESELLAEAEESTGKFYYRAPDQARFEIEGPEPTVMLMRGEELLVWYPALGRAERQAGGRYVGRIMEMLAGGGIAEMTRRFSTRAAFPTDPEAPWRLTFEPRSRRLAKHLEELEVWLDRELYAPVFLRVQESTGSTEIRLSNLEPDVELPAETFELELPIGTEVVDLGGSDR